MNNHKEWGNKEREVGWRPGNSRTSEMQGGWGLLFGVEALVLCPPMGFLSASSVMSASSVQPDWGPGGSCAESPLQGLI